MKTKNREAARKNKCPKHMKKNNLGSSSSTSAEKIMDENDQFDEDGFYPISGDKPFFHLIMKKSALSHAFLMIFPNGLRPMLPSTTVRATVTFRGRDLKMMFYGKRQQKALGSGWRQFVRAQKLKVGDAIVFEVMESNDERLHFKIQILRCPTTEPAQDEGETRVTSSTNLEEPSSSKGEESDDDLDDDDDDYDVDAEDDE